MHILFISWWWPYPANNGSKIRAYNLLRRLGEAHQVSLLSFAEADEATSAQIEHLKGFCTHVESVAKPHFQPKALRATLGYFSPWPRSLVDMYSPAMEKRVEDVVRHSPPDLIIGSEFQTLRYLELAPTIPAILEQFEITRYYELAALAGSASSRFRAQLTLSKLKNTIRTLANRGVVFSVVSDAEKAYVQDAAPDARAEVIPNGVDTDLNQPDPAAQPKPNTLIYTGAVTYSANYEAVRYFISEVLPLVRARIPDVQFMVTGSTGDVDVSDLTAQPNVTFSGYLASLADTIRESWALVVPLRSGSGTRLKILEAMALGTPVVSTHKGAEGLALEGDKHLLLADSPADMTDAICRLLGDADLRARLAADGRTRVETHYDWGIISQQLLRLIDEITPASVKTP